MNKKEKINWEMVLKTWNAEYKPFTETLLRAQVEIQLATLLTEARVRFEKALEDYQKERDWKKYSSAVEMFINAYNELCFRVLNETVSKEWFNDLYKNELLTLTTIDTNFKTIYERNIENYNPIKKCLEMIKKEENK